MTLIETGRDPESNPHHEGLFMPDYRMSPKLSGFDTETHLIAAGNIMPRLVCGTWDTAEWGDINEGAKGGFSNGDHGLLETLIWMFEQAADKALIAIIQNAAFDLCVVMRYLNDVQQGLQPGDPVRAKYLYDLVWYVLDTSMEEELGGGRPMVSDTIIREKLFNLSTHGGIDNNRGRDLRYDLATLVMNYFKVDISSHKIQMGQNGRILNHLGQDITGSALAGSQWRLRFSELDGIPFTQWPTDASEYAIDDSTWARKIYVMQEAKRQPRGYGSMNSESLQVYADMALRLFSSNGFRIDMHQVTKVAAVVDHILNQCEGALNINGIIQKGSVKMAALAERIERAWAVKGEPVMLTDGGDSGNCKTAASGEVLEALAGIDPILDLYARRQEVVKLRDAFLPNLRSGHVYTNFDVLKETGRCSSYGNSDKAKRKPLYDAVNIQQIPRGQDENVEKGHIEIHVRECFLPPENMILVSCDYSALELCSVAQVTYSLFGRSVHRDKNLLGYDLHSFLGAGLARALQPALVEMLVDLDEAYRAFLKNRKASKGIKDEDMSVEAVRARELVDSIKLFRNFAKPVGLGFPGGLGAKTLVTFARTTYHVNMTVDQANVFRELWREIYPEMPEFFRWLNSQVDHTNVDSKGGETYWYETQGYNRMRAGAGYCAAANGKSMQSLSSDGAKRGVAWLARACYGGYAVDHPYSLLSGCVPQAFIHDENLVGIADDILTTERALLVSKIMIDAMQISMPDVLIGCEPAAMRRWTKKAEAIWEDDHVRANMVKQYLCDTSGEPFYQNLVTMLGPTYKPGKRLVPYDDRHAVV